MRKLICGLYGVLLCLCVCLLYSCSNNSDTLPSNILVELNDSDFYLKSLETDSVYYPFMISGGKLHYNVNNNEDLNTLKLFFPNKLNAYVNEKVLFSGNNSIDFSDLSKPVTVTFISSTGNKKNVQIVIFNIPVVMIETPDGKPIVSREVRTDSCVVELVEGGAKTDLGIADIKCRGGSTFHLSKKPYNIKLRKKRALLGMPKSKHWILLANAFYDRSQLHNDVAFEMARMTDYPWVQSGTFVELILNGSHRGLYYLCEKIGEEKTKMNIDIVSSTDTVGATINGGYLLEMYEAPGLLPTSFATDYFNMTGGDLQMPYGWILKKPEDNVPQTQFEYIKKELNHMESLIWDDDSLLTGQYMDYLDIESAINWWLVEEAALNEEASRSKNVYIYKHRDEKIFRVGPPWDFDAWSFGLKWGVERFYCKETALWYRQLFKDPKFVKRVKEKWKVYYKEWKTVIPDYMEKRYNYIHKAAERNETIWKEWQKLNEYPDKSYKQVVDQMCDNLMIQLDWMNNQITNM